MVTATELFADYNYYRLHTRHIESARQQGKYIRYLDATPERMRYVEAMRVWCEGKAYSPRHWLCWLFYRNRWGFSRPLNQLVPKSWKSAKIMIAAYENCRFLPMYDRRMRQLRHAADVAAGTVYDRNRDMSTTTEHLKRRYMQFNDPEGCLTDDRANGYHPRSPICGQCRLAQACEAKLRSEAVYDIVALRRGEITVAQAKREVCSNVR